MTSWQSDDAETNGIRLHYTRTGGDKPPLVLAHGVTDSGLCWTPIAEVLAPDYDVIMVEARGHGRSEAPQQGYDSPTQAADLADLIGALGLHKPSVLGHSMGAVTTLVLAGMYPDVPGAIILEDPPGWWASGLDSNSAEDERLAGMRAWFSSFKRKSRAELIADQRAANPRWPEAELGPWADAKLQVSDNVMSMLTQAMPRGRLAGDPPPRRLPGAAAHRRPGAGGRAHGGSRRGAASAGAPAPDRPYRRRRP
jgi:pimeloyl-ACP methyl ester carboxylesterase